MKSYFSKIAIIILVLLNSCSERSLFTDPTDPGLGGVFTVIKGELSEPLLKSKSPYYVSADISVTAGTTLTIEPGTLIFFKSDAGLYISGGIRAIGSKESRIVFEGFGTAWKGVHSENPTDSLIFIFCDIKEAYLPIGSDSKFGAIETSYANVVVKNCYFNYNYSQYGGGITLLYCNSEIINNIFFDNECLDYGGAITVVDPVYEEIQNNIFYKNFSYRGDTRIHFVSGDSIKIFEQYNFLDPDSLDPFFISETDYHLQENSPCKDAGNPTPEFNDWDGSRNDQGAYGGPKGNW